MPGLTLYFYDESVYASGRAGDGRAVAMLGDAPLFKHDFLVDEVTLVSSAEELAATATRPSLAPSDAAGVASAASPATRYSVAPTADASSEGDFASTSRALTACLVVVSAHVSV